MVEMVNAAGVALTEIESALVLEKPAASATFAVKLNVPAVKGVPLMTPVLVFRLTPPGRLPADTDQVYGIVPPLACNVAL